MPLSRCLPNTNLAEDGRWCYEAPRRLTGARRAAAAAVMYFISSRYGTVDVYVATELTVGLPSAMPAWASRSVGVHQTKAQASTKRWARRVSQQAGQPSELHGPKSVTRNPPCRLKVVFAAITLAMTVRYFPA